MSVVSLQLTLARARGDALAAHRLIVRFRNLYIRLCREAILTDPTSASLERAAERMRAVGLYAPTRGLRDIRFAILKRLWTLQTGKHRWTPWERDGWHNWYQREGFTAGDWRRAAS